MGCLLALLAAAAVTMRSHGDAIHTQPRQVVILLGQPVYRTTPDGGVHYTGISVWCNDSSVGSQTFGEGAGLSEAIAQLLSQGFMIQHVEGQNYTLVK